MSSGGLTQLLASGRRFRRSFLAITLIETIYASCCINQLLFAGEEGMARRADFDVQVAILRGASLKAFATRAGDVYFLILRMNFWFHGSLRILGL